MSGLLAARVLLVMVREYRLVRQAKPYRHPTGDSARRSVAGRFGLACEPRLRVLPQAPSPMIWSWGRRPVVLLPPRFAAEADEAELEMVLCHELAHCRRRDHVSALLAAVALCVFPWHPLMWWAARRLEALSERACDLWAMSVTRSPVRYAETLLRLAPPRGTSIGLAAVRGRGKLYRRIHHILNAKPGNPSLGKRWAALTVVAAVVGACIIACAHPRALAASAAASADRGELDTTTTRPTTKSATSQPDRAALASPIIATEEMRAHLQALSKAMEGISLEYTWKEYRGHGSPPEDPPASGRLHFAADRRVVRLGEAYRVEGLTTHAEERFGYSPGSRGVTTWDGWIERNASTLPLARRESWGGRYRDHERSGSISDRPWHRSEADQVDRNWQGLAVKLPRRVDLADVFDHPSLRGPLFRHDGRTEWQVIDPEEWRFEFRDRPHAYISLIAERTDDRIRLAEIRRVFANERVQSTRRLVLGREVFSDEIPIPTQALQTEFTSWVDRDPFWTHTRIDLFDAQRRPLATDTFYLEFDGGAMVWDERYQIEYVVASDTINLIGRGKVVDTGPLPGDVGEGLSRWVAEGRLVHPPERDVGEPIGVGDMDLPPGHKVDLGSGGFHVFTVTNETDATVTIKEIKTSGKAIGTVKLGYEPDSGGVSVGLTGQGTILEPGESTQMFVSFSHGIGLWRHAVTLVTDGGDEWHYQLSVTGIFKPIATPFIRGGPDDPHSGLIRAGLLLLTLAPETEPLQLLAPPGATLRFDHWVTLTKYHALGGSPTQQIGYFTLDMSGYGGEYPCLVKLRTAAGAEGQLAIMGP